MDLGDGRRHGESLHRGRLGADAAVECGAGGRAGGLLVADLCIPHVALEAGVGGVGGVEDLFERPDRGLLIVGSLREAFLQQLLDRAEGVVAEEAGDRAGGAEEVLDVLNVAVDVAEHAFDGVDGGEHGRIDCRQIRLSGGGVEQDAADADCSRSGEDEFAHQHLLRTCLAGCSAGCIRSARYRCR